MVANDGDASAVVVGLLGSDFTDNFGVCDFFMLV